MHTGPYKELEQEDYWKWNIWYLKMLREISIETYNEIINLSLYEDIKEIIDTGSGIYAPKKDNEEIIEEFDWDKLEYPRAFEDIYDPVWRDS